VLAVLDREASVLEQGRPLGKCKTAPVTRIAKLLEIVIHGRPIARVGRDVVHEREYAVRDSTLNASSANAPVFSK